MNKAEIEAWCTVKRRCVCNFQHPKCNTCFQTNSAEKVEVYGCRLD